MKARESLRWICIVVLAVLSLGVLFETATIAFAMRGHTETGEPWLLWGVGIWMMISGVATATLLLLPAIFLFQRRYGALSIVVSIYAAVAVYFSLSGLMEWKKVDERLSAQRGPLDASRDDFVSRELTYTVLSLLVRLAPVGVSGYVYLRLYRRLQKISPMAPPPLDRVALG